MQLAFSVEPEVSVICMPFGEAPDNFHSPKYFRISFEVFSVYQWEGRMALVS
jgi:hypothetical protein